MPPTNPAPVNGITPAGNSNPSKDEDNSLEHSWVGAAIVHLTDKKARRIMKYQSYRADEGEKIPVLDVYCEDCRRNIEDVYGLPCQAKVNNHHLIGGDQTVRAKRKHNPMPAGVVPMPGPRINRRGIDAVIRGEA